MAKTAYMVNGTVATSIKEVVNLLGYAVNKRDILAGTIDGVSIYNEEEQEPVANLSDVDTEEISQLQQDAREHDDSYDGDMKPSDYDRELIEQDGITEPTANCKHCGEPVFEVGKEFCSEACYESYQADMAHEPDNEEGDTPEDTEESIVCVICNCDVDADSYATDADDNPICDACLSAARKQQQVPTIAGKAIQPNQQIKVTVPTRESKPANKPTGNNVKAGKVEVIKDSEGNVEYPEKGYFADDKAVKRYIKKLTDDQLYEWCELEGVTWNINDHAGINRMRAAMAMKAYQLDTPTAGSKGGSGKKKGKYSHYELEELVQMALDNDVDVKPYNGDDMRILRMYTIMALKGAGILE